MSEPSITRLPAAKKQPYELLQLYRHRLGLNQSQFAGVLQLKTRRMVQTWETGEALPRPANLRKLVEAFLSLGAFPAGQEREAACHLWQVVKAAAEEGLHRLEYYPVFDDSWFEGLLVARGNLPNPSPTPTPPQSEVEEAEPAEAIIEEKTAPEKALAGPLPGNLALHFFNNFINRGQDRFEVPHLLQAHRLVVLTGPPGSGKTRLALEVARQLQPAYPDGVWLVELAALNTPGLVAQVVATTLGVKEQANLSLPAVLAAFLKPKTLLLLLDNCEHVLGECVALVQELLKQCPRLSVLATSRTQFDLPGAKHWAVLPLAAPGLTRIHQIHFKAAEARRYDSVQLFVECATAVQHSFQLEDENAGAVAEICYQLDGLPLALELAAARVRSLTVEQINERLADRFGLLNRGSQARADHQQTLRATLDWSYKLLNPSEQYLLTRLAALSGSWKLAAAEQMVDEAILPANAVLDVLSELVDKSLVVAERAGKTMRYRLLETVRVYGLEKLKQRGALEEVRQRHARYFGQRFAEQQLALARWDAATIQELNSLLDNGRSAWEWALEQGDTALLMQLGKSLSAFYQHKGYIEEGLRLFEQALQRFAYSDSEKADKEFMVWLLLEKAAFLNHKGSCDKALASVDAAQGLLRRLAAPNPALQELYHRTRGDVLRRSGKYRAALEEFQRVWEYGRLLGDEYLEAEGLKGLASAALVLRDFPAVQHYCQQALALPTVQTIPLLSQIFLKNLGFISKEQGRPDKALYYFEQALQAVPADTDLYNTGTLLSNLGTVYLQLGEYALAQRQFEKAHALQGDGQALFMRMYNLSYLGLLRHLQDDQMQALDYLAQALALSGEVKTLKLKGDTLTRLGQVYTALERYTEAEKVYTEALALGREINQADEIVAALEGLVRLTALRLPAERHLETKLRAWVEELVGWLANEAFLRFGVTERFPPYPACYYGLVALGERARAVALIQNARRQLEEMAAPIEDEIIQASFLYKMKVHHEIMTLAAETAGFAPAKPDNLPIRPGRSYPI